MALYVSAISLHNIRSFGDRLTLHLSRRSVGTGTKPRLHTILIGENGTCKTTLLRAVAIGLADEKDTSGLLAEPTGQFVAEGAPRATIVIELRDAEGAYTREVKTVIGSENGQDILENKTPPESVGVGLVCAYGISRANDEGSDTGRSYRLVDSVYTLFHYSDELISTELAIRRLEDFLGAKWYPRVMDRIKSALGLPTTVKIELPKGGGVRVSGPGVGKSIPFEGWADGYRRTLGWILDFYHWAMRAECISETGDVAGIVLLDELEQHLHPSMQIGFPSRLKQLLPNVQFIATTHSPLVALGSVPDELVVLKRAGETVEANEAVRDFHGYSVEDMLVDPELFASSVYGPDVTQKLEQYREIIQRPPQQRTKQDEADLRTLGSELMSYGIPEARGENPALKELQAILKRHNL